MTRLLACLGAVLCLVGSVSVPHAAAVPATGIVQPAGSMPIPDGPAQAWIVADMDTGAVLAARDEHGHFAPASTIKVLLALVALDQVSLDSTVVADAADADVECSCVGIEPGRTYTARQLLDGLLLVSGNDAANTLARMLGGAESAVDKMNAKAALLGAYGTNVGSPSGIDAPGMAMWSTPHDLAVIFRSAMSYPVFAEITAQHSAVFPTKTGEKVLVNQDDMMARYPGMLGGKTGYTDLARKTFVGAAQRNGRRLVVAMMYGLVREGGPSYWDQAATLLDWGFAQDRSAAVGTL